jgi:anti-sigma regulatory factor (Ser/Thr protein kinase)
MVAGFAARVLHEMTTLLELILPNRPSEIARLQDQLEALARQRGLPPKTLHEVQLAVEEHLTNILHYAFDDQGEHLIGVRVRVAATELRLEVEDDGRPFNPLKHPEPDLSQPVSERPIGGLGIHMMRKSMDCLEYRRTDGKNILVMIKQIKAPVP